jgi:hypothetical protein
LDEFKEMVEALGYELDMSVRRDMVDTTVFGATTKTYLAGEWQAVLVLRGPKGVNMIQCGEKEAKARAVAWMLE